MARQSVSIDAAALLVALTARDEGLVATYLDLRGGALHRVYDPALVRTNDAFEARVDADPDRYVKVPLYSREYRLMTEFIDTVDDDDLARLLDAALAGHSAFRRFDAVLTGWPDERERWEAYRRAALFRWAAAWLRSFDVEPAWDRPIPAEALAEEPTEAPWLVRIALDGRSGDGDGDRVRTLGFASDGEAQIAFLRLARELCELSREPFRRRAFQGRTRFVRCGVEVRRDGAAVTIAVRG